MNAHWDVTWGVWAASTLMSFGIIEAAALIHHHPERTLSDRLRSWLGIEPRRRWRTFGVAVFLGFFVWFIPHILWPLLEKL